jgi:hypothetical protein
VHIEGPELEISTYHADILAEKFGQCLGLPLALCCNIMETQVTIDGDPALCSAMCHKLHGNNHPSHRCVDPGPKISQRSRQSDPTYEQE